MRLKQMQDREHTEMGTRALSAHESKRHPKLLFRIVDQPLRRVITVFWTSREWLLRGEPIANGETENARGVRNGLQGWILRFFVLQHPTPSMEMEINTSNRLAGLRFKDAAWNMSP